MGCPSPFWPPLRHGGFWEGAPWLMDVVLGPSFLTCVGGAGTLLSGGPPGAKGRVQQPMGGWGPQFLGEASAGWTHPKPGAHRTPGGT